MFNETRRERKKNEANEFVFIQYWVSKVDSIAQNHSGSRLSLRRTIWTIKRAGKYFLDFWKKKMRENLPQITSIRFCKIPKLENIHGNKLEALVQFDDVKSTFPKTSKKNSFREGMEKRYDQAGHSFFSVNGDRNLYDLQWKYPKTSR